MIRVISAKKGEPEFLLEWRLEASSPLAHHDTAEVGRCRLPRYRLPGHRLLLGAQEEGRAEESRRGRPRTAQDLREARLPLHERAWLAGVAVDAVFDSVSVATTFQKELGEHGIIFCSFSEAVKNHPDLVRQYLGTVVPPSDNFYAALNSAVFSDGSFVFIPKGVKCPMELSTHFRINARDTGQFERTLIIAEEGASVSYLEGCTAPMRDENQLHAAVVELIALDDAKIKYSTVQNWYPGDKDGIGGIYNFVTKRGDCAAHARTFPGPRSRPARRSPGNTPA